MTDLALFPIDTLKTRIQSRSRVELKRQEVGESAIVGNNALSLGNSNCGAIGETHSQAAHSQIVFSQAAHSPVAQSPLALSQAAQFPLALSNTKGLYSGIGFVLLAAIPSATTFFSIYSLCRWNGTGDAIAALAAEFSSTTIRQPLEVLKQKRQAGILSPPHLSYRGYFATLMRDLPFALVQYPLFEALKPAYGALPAAFTAGIVAGAVTTPLDWIKTRIIVFGAPISLVKTVQNEGIGVMFTGMKERVLWISLGACMFLGTFSFLQSATFLQ